MNHGQPIDRSREEAWLAGVDRLGAVDSEPVRCELHLLKDLYDNPALLAPPRVVVPRVAFRGRMTLIPAARKTGKSTFMGSVLAAASAGRDVFGEPLEAPVVILWACLDEPVADLVRRLRAQDADPLQVFIVPGPAKTSELVEVARRVSADVLVVDTISDLSFGEVESENDSMQVKRLLAPLRALARDEEMSVILLHHTNRATGTSRGSGAFEDMADLILRLAVDKDDHTVRKITAEGRVGVEDFRVRWTPEGFELADREPTPMQLVEMAVFANPGITTRAVREKVAMKTATVSVALADLAALGRIENRGNRTASQWFLREAGKHSGNSTANDGKPAWETPGNTRETPWETLSVTTPEGGNTEREPLGAVA